ncbi:hypothetical protein EYF80_031729 [Liparis tanakae]|uniref:Uncharacterized protein n=1 Tax=Liparis tanakae TaxID=230148 RepID=A0A4Z2GWM4_9TELE|nr:hypothetical protein EYF80_031729 [Liparis tanakae]
MKNPAAATNSSKMKQMTGPMMIFRTNRDNRERRRRLLTFRHCAGADIRGHAAAERVGRVVAGVDLDLVAGEVAQGGDDRGLLGMDVDHDLCALKVLLVLGDLCAVGRAGGGGEEGPQHRVPWPCSSVWFHFCSSSLSTCVGTRDGNFIPVGQSLRVVLGSLLKGVAMLHMRSESNTSNPKHRSGHTTGQPQAIWLTLLTVVKLVELAGFRLALAEDHVFLHRDVACRLRGPRDDVIARPLRRVGLHPHGYAH